MEWHRLFGLVLTDYFTGSPFEVQIEPDLSLQQQFLDLVIVRRGKGAFKEKLPDGLDDLGRHNLVTFKSHRDALTGWVMSELVGHYVSYRKLISPSVDDLLPEGHFQLYAVCARYPHNLAQQVPWKQTRPGVYHCHWGTERIRVVVARELPQTENNAPLHLFAADAERVKYGRSHYQKRSDRTSSVMDLLLEKYKGEGSPMPYTMDDFIRDYTIDRFKKLTPEQRLAALRSVPPEELQKTLKELLPSLTPEQLEDLQKPLTSTAPTKPEKAGRGARKRRRP
jgi:hypothetical protein